MFLCVDLSILCCEMPLPLYSLVVVTSMAVLYTAVVNLNAPTKCQSSFSPRDVCEVDVSTKTRCRSCSNSHRKAALPKTKLSLGHKR